MSWSMVFRFSPQTFSKRFAEKLLLRAFDNAIPTHIGIVADGQTLNEEAN